MKNLRGIRWRKAFYWHKPWPNWRATFLLEIFTLIIAPKWGMADENIMLKGVYEESLTDPNWPPKNVTSLTRGPNWPFTCLDGMRIENSLWMMKIFECWRRQLVLLVEKLAFEKEICSNASINVLHKRLANYFGSDKTLRNWTFKNCELENWINSSLLW